jgi:hypothetical protein
MRRMIWVVTAAMLCTMSEVEAQRREDVVLRRPVGWHSSMRLHGFPLPQAPDPLRHAGITRFIGAFLGSSIAMAVVTRDDAAITKTDYFLHVAGTAAGAASVTAAWEKPRIGILAGAAIGSLPLLAAAGEDPDDVPWIALLAWLAAPYFATLGQGL